MASVLYNEGAVHMLSLYFENSGAAFDTIYVGLGSGGVNFDRDATISDITEITAAGYSRQAITRDATDTGWSFQQNLIVTPQLTYSNTDLHKYWPPVDFAFFTLSATGNDDPDILIAAVELDDSVLIAPRFSRNFILKLGL